MQRIPSSAQVGLLVAELLRASRAASLMPPSLPWHNVHAALLRLGFDVGNSFLAGMSAGPDLALATHSPPCSAASPTTQPSVRY